MPGSGRRWVLDRPTTRELGLCWGRQKLSKGTWEGAREPAWMGATTPGTRLEGATGSVNARVGGWVLACRTGRVLVRPQGGIGASGA